MLDNIETDNRTPEEILLDLVIQERIEYVMGKFKKKTKEEQEAVKQLIHEAEKIIYSLPEEQTELLLKYVNSQFDQLGEQQIYLYRSGLKDGIRFMKKLKDL